LATSLKLHLFEKPVKQYFGGVVYDLCVRGYRGMGRTDKMDCRAKGEVDFLAIELCLLDSVQCPDR